MADWYVDFSAGVDGSGTTIISPYNTIVGKTFGGGDRVWLRRAGFLTLSATINMNQPVTFIGWPMVGDDFYDIRATSPTWDSDGAVAAEIRATSSAYRIYFPDPLNQGGPCPDKVYRVYFNNTDVSGVGSGEWVRTYRTITYKNCRFSSRGMLSIDIQPLGIVPPIVNGSKFYNCEFDVADSTGTVNPGAAISVNNTTAPLFDTCSVVVTGAHCNGLDMTDLTYTKGAPTFKSCSITSTSNFQYLVNIFRTTNDPVVFMNCTIDSTGGTGTQAFFSKGQLYIVSTILRCDWAHIENLGWAHFLEFTQYGGKAYGLYVRGQGTIQLQNVSFGGGNTNNIDSANGVTVLINNGTWPGSNNERLNVYVKNTDDYHQYSLPGEVIRSSVNRGTFSLKMFCNWSADIVGPLVYGIPGYEELFVRLPPGTWTLTLFGAYKTFTPTRNDVWFDVEYYDSTDQHRAYANTKSNNPLTSDSSVWTGDTGLTSFKIQTTITVTKYGLMPIRVYLNKYDVVGYIYIDPKILVG